MANIKEYISQIAKYGLAPTNRFQVIIPLPDSLRTLTTNISQRKTESPFGKELLDHINSFAGSGLEITKNFELMIKQADLPGKSITTSDVKYNGDFHKVGFSNVYEDLNIVFNVSQDMYEMNIIDEWMELVFNPITHEISYLDDYVTNITINQLDRQDNIVYSIVLKDAYPILCSGVPISNDDQNTLMSLSVTFAYKRWERVESQRTELEGIDSLSETPFGPLVTPFLAKPGVQNALGYLESQTGVSLEGDAVDIYNQVDEIVRESTDTNINKTASLLESIRASTSLNDRLSTAQKAEIISIIDGTLTQLKG